MAKHPKNQTLTAGVALGRASAGSAIFEGWEKIPGPGKLLKGSFGDGTVVYRSRKDIWVARP